PMYGVPKARPSKFALDVADPARALMTFVRESAAGPGDFGKKTTPADSLVPLFNGKDLSGWRISKDHDPGLWKVEDGILTGKQTDGGSALRTVLVSDRKDLVNLRAQIEMKMGLDADGNVGSNGVMLHGQPRCF